MKCVNCGNDIPDKAKFCPYCGTQNEPKQKAAGNEQTTRAISATVGTTWSESNGQLGLQLNFKNRNRDFGSYLCDFCHTVFYRRCSFFSVHIFLGICNVHSTGSFNIDKQCLFWWYGSNSSAYWIFKTA